MTPAGERPARDSAEAIRWLRSPAAVRARTAAILEAGREDRLAHFRVDESRLAATARYVADVIRQSFPDLAVPARGLWDRFAAGGIDRWGGLAEEMASASDEEVARVGFDLATVGALLDGDPGPRWRFREAARDGAPAGAYGGREGVAVATLRLFASGALSAVDGQPLRADAAALSALDEATLARAFQVGDDNPFPGLAARVRRLNRLGAALAARPDVFGAALPRVGPLCDGLAAEARDGRIDASAVLSTVLDALGPVWPGRFGLAGVDLGDVWHHPATRADDMTDGLVPFHKVPQRLVLSLFEPLEAAGVRVVGREALTGLADERSGGLLLDTGVLRPRRPAILDGIHEVGAEAVVEWRALTVALLDPLAEAVRGALGVDAARLPLAAVQEGGTGPAGRRIAGERRADAAPPLRVAWDGTVF